MPPKPLLVLIDGAPGLGKTTLLRNLSSALPTGGDTRAVFCHEHDHPLHAFWNWGDGYDPDEVVEEPFSADKFIVRLLARTYTFVERMLSERMSAVLETYPFQSPVRNMLKMLGTTEDCADYFCRFCQAVAFCNPLLVYLEHDEWRERLLQVAEDRGRGFKAVFFDAFYRSPWGQKHGINSPAGVLDFYQHYLRVCERLLSDWPYRLLHFDPIQLGPEGTCRYVLPQMKRV